MELLPTIQLIADQLYKSDAKINVTAARLIGNGRRILSITEKVRTSLLAFSMEIAERFGYEVEINEYNSKQNENNQIINHFMVTNNITNSGDGNIVNTGDNSKIKADISIAKGNKGELGAYLKQNGIDESDTQELIAMVDLDKPDAESRTFGKNV